VDVLDRLLDRGAVLAADIVITVAGEPMLGLSLRAALGGIDALVAYGVFAADDPVLGLRPPPGAPGAGLAPPRPGGGDGEA